MPFYFTNLFMKASSLYPRGPLKAITYLFSLFAELLFIHISSNMLSLPSQSEMILTTAG